MAFTYSEARAGWRPRRASGNDQAERLIDPDHKHHLRHRQAGPNWLSGAWTYAGLTAFGRVTERGGAYLAFDSLVRRLGEFPTGRAATAAISAAHRGERRTT